VGLKSSVAGKGNARQGINKHVQHLLDAPYSQPT